MSVGLTQSDIDAIAATTWGEARGESLEGQQAVVDVILNRMASPNYPNTALGVIMQDRQFSILTGPDRAVPAELRGLTPEERLSSLQQAMPAARRGIVAEEILLAALNAWTRALRRDECGDWRISGKQGCIYADPGGGYRLFVACQSVRAWTAAKKRLAFCTVAQDGDEEGVLTLAGLPSPEQAAAIRDVLGIRKRLEHSREALERMRRNAFQPAGKEGFSVEGARDGAGPSHPAPVA